MMKDSYSYRVGIEGAVALPAALFLLATGR